MELIFHAALYFNSYVKWSALIGHMILQDSCANMFSGTSPKEEAGTGAFMWYLQWLDLVVQKTKKSNNDDSMPISINVFEFISVVLTYFAAYVVIA